MKPYFLKPSGSKTESLEEILYSNKTKEPIGSRVLKHLGIVCAGVYLGSLITDNLELGLLSLGLAWGSVGARHLLYRRRE